MLKKRIALRPAIRTATLFVLFLTLMLQAGGQAVSVNGGSIQGSITDASGAVVPGAQVVILSADNGYTKTLATDSAGFYSVGPLNPGNYTVTVSAPGFSRLAVKTVVRTGTATSGNYKLTLGEASQTVEVNAGAIQINTEQLGVSDVITRQQIDSLPINGRNFLDVAQVEPGVILQSGETFDPTKAGYSAISVGGVSGRTTRILLDGQDITDETVGTTIMNVSTGAIDEFQLNRSTQDVSGEVTSTGQVLVSTQSGTNKFHGQLFYNFQDHRAGFARTTNGFDAPFQRNQFGGNFGGYLIKDKLFFFADAERIKQANEASATLSTFFTDPANIVGDPALSAPIGSLYPFIPSPYKETYSTIRVDYNGPFGGHYFVRGAYNVNSSDSNYGDIYSLYQSRNNVPAIVGGADFTTGRFTHSIRGGYEKFHNLLLDGTAGLTSIYNPLANVTLLGPGIDAGPNFLAPQGTYQSDKQLRYDGTWTRGAHNVKFGASLNRLLGGGFAAFYGPSLYTVFGSASALKGKVTTLNPTGAGCNGVVGAPSCIGDPANGYAAEVYVLGNGNGFFTEKPGFGLPGGGVEDWRSGAYVADTWKITSYFTATAGIRYSVDTDRANQDLATPLCSSVDPLLQFPGCNGNTPLFDQFQAGFGKKTHQPYANFGPQAGFVFSPGDHKTAIRGGVGIFYESDIFNNTSNARSAVVQAQGKYFNYTTVCGGTNVVVIPGTGPVTTVNGVSIKTICGEPISQAAPQINALKAQYQAASSGGGANPSFIGGLGGGLHSVGIYGAPYKTPYSIQINGGVQREIAKGTIVSVDFVHNATIKIPLVIDVNHVGAARFLNTTAAQAAITATTTSFGCTGGYSAGAIDCAIAAGAQITDFAGNGLDSANQLNGGYPVSYAGGNTPAFAGANPNVGLGEFILPVGRSGYDALQVVLRQQVAHPAPGIASGNFQVSYSLSRSVNPISGTNNSDQFFNSVPYDFDNPNLYIGRSALDHTNELSFGGSVIAKYGVSVGVIGHFFSAPPTTLTLDNSSGAPGEIFRTDVTGDGTTGDIVPGTVPGAYMHSVKGPGLNKLINNYNATKAGTPTPAGNALIAAGLFSAGQLLQLGGVQQPIAASPTTPLNNSAFRAFDANISYPIRLNRFREGLSIEPSVAIYNVANLANFSHYNGQLASVATAGGPTGAGLTTNLNGDNNAAVQNSLRVQRGSGTFDQGAPRTTEFQLKLNF